MSVQSAEPVESQLAKCDAALNAKVQEASLCNLGVKLRTDELTRVNEENMQLRKQGTSLFTNPFVYAAIGVIFGAWAGARVTR